MPADYFQILMSVHWELTTVIKCVTTPLAPTIAAVILATIFSTRHTFAQVYMHSILTPCSVIISVGEF